VTDIEAADSAPPAPAREPSARAQRLVVAAVAVLFVTAVGGALVELLW
jgi:hypothetical protein